MYKVFKYKLSTDTHQELALPNGSEILCVLVQLNVPYIYVKVKEEYQIGEYELTMFRVSIYSHNTGEQIHPKAKEYVGSYQLNEQRVVGHVFVESKSISLNKAKDSANVSM